MTRRPNDLEPIDPQDALDLYIQTIEGDKSQATIYSHSSRLGHFVRWCNGTKNDADENGAETEEDADEPRVTNLNNITGRDLHRYRLWRRDDGDLNTVSEKTQMDTLRVFIRFCESIDAVRPDLATKVVSPTLDTGENARDVMLDPDVAHGILDWLNQYRYASTVHVTLALAWRCHLRRGGLRALDVDDYNADEKYLDVQHRPETDTPLKNKDAGERFVALRDDTAQLLDDYLNSPDRHDTADDHGRDPLLTTSHGRPHVMTIASWIWGVTRPCVSTDECPEGRDIEECDAAAQRQAASGCPVSVSPHAVRRGAITHWLSEDVPPSEVGQRANVDPDTIDKHYDERGKQARMEQRRRFLDRFTE
ncbi:integrase family protein [Natrinema thermotolerans DSM 11552]|nr:integrase family protein [Natrinema thermotolerans DSM 11552]